MTDRMHLRFDVGFVFGILSNFTFLSIPVGIVLWAALVLLLRLEPNVSADIAVVAILTPAYAVAVIYCIKPLFWRVEVDFKRRRITLPYWHKVDSSGEVATMFDGPQLGRSLFDRSLPLFWFPLLAHQKEIPFAEIRSVALAEKYKLFPLYGQQYQDDNLAYRKLSNYQKWITSERDDAAVAGAISGLLAGNELMEPRTSSNINGATLGLAGGAAYMVLGPWLIGLMNRNMLPELVIAIRTPDEFIIRSLAPYRHDDPTYLVEALRLAGLRVLSPEDTAIRNLLKASFEMLKRSFKITTFGAIIFSMCSVVALLLFFDFAPAIPIEQYVILTSAILVFDTILFWMASL